ncbi:S-adenosylmethionine:tRNA ribosyltransferase-isomerase [Pseudonocardia nigra]|uniref:S-adenosylmethionine:tRNA ribosyltransferase-isomerase n=1 Tax=Pseudonocardia nigra TaxID=1921578 RepID=UPI001C5E87D6|nr:S-adenosylmethionine:tRNA ribosyltransferase-isomerase [Pseudonocardia nigra]
MRSATAFTVPPELSAAEPPEARGLARDEVRLLVASDRTPLRHTMFRELPGALRRGDLVVVNTSDTEPAAVDGHRPDGRPVTLHVSGPAPDGAHVVELRTQDGHRVTDAVAGESVRLPCGVVAVLLTGHPDPRIAAGSRLWRARIPVAGGLRPWLSCAGRPIRYSYLRGHWPLEAYRTVFAAPGTEFGSAEMPSAGRPFTAAVLDGLRASGVGVAELVLHTGVSSLEAGEVPQRERYRVSAAAADAVNATRAAGGRVVAVGTTVTRALETAADEAGRVHPSAGWTDLVLGPHRPARVVDGLVTGWHEPEASHLLLLEAVAGARLVARAYAAALDHRYLWHEFGDSCLFLPTVTTRRAA